MKLLRKGQVLLFEQLEVSLGFERVRAAEARERDQANIDCRISALQPLRRHLEHMVCKEIGEPRESADRVPYAQPCGRCEPAYRRGDGAPRRLHESRLASSKRNSLHAPRRCTLRKKTSPGANDSCRGQARQFFRACGTLVDSPQRPYRFRDRWPRSDTFQQSLDQTASRVGTRMHTERLPLCLSGSPCPEALAPSPTRLNA